MPNPVVALELGRRIAELLEASGASQIEQYAALEIARQLVPLAGASLMDAESSRSSRAEN